MSWERVVEFTKCFLSSGTFAVFLSLSCSWGPSTQRPTYCKTGREHLAMGPAGSSHSLGDLARLKAVQTKIQGFQGPQIQLPNSAIFHPAIAIVASSVPMKGARCDQVARPSPWQQGLLYSFPLGLLICFPSSELLWALARPAGFWAAPMCDIHSLLSCLLGRPGWWYLVPETPQWTQTPDTVSW